MKDALKPILEVQELDIKMIRLMRIKKQRKDELQQIETLKEELKQQYEVKEQDIAKLNEEVSSLEQKIEELSTTLKSLEEKQPTVKKVEEFNALTQEMTTTERQKIQLEQQVSNLVDERVAEEEVLEKIKESLKASVENSKELEDEIKASISKINEEGSVLKDERDGISKSTDQEILRIYERLLKNKRDRVVVPIENRTCSGCHIALTAQHENLVRKGSNLVFCEHCSRIHYWQDSEPTEGTTTRRRRRKVSSPS